MAVAKPHHVSQFVGDDGSDPFLVGIGREALVIEESRLPVGDQAPVLHGPSVEVWESDLVCMRKEVGFVVSWIFRTSKHWANWDGVPVLLPL